MTLLGLPRPSESWSDHEQESVARRYAHRYAVVDVETSGLKPTSHRVLQIAVAQLDSRGRLEDAWSTVLNPGCDLGPVHIHGLTPEHLAGAPQYPHVAGKVEELLRDRVLVAHNARFDWEFLDAEARRVDRPLQVQQRLCTMSLVRRLELPVPDLTLAGVAEHLGVAQHRAHDAQDDTRVLVEIFRRCLAEASRVHLRLPLTPCVSPSTTSRFPPTAPRQVCPWANPGRFRPGEPLVQGMKVAFTGWTRVPREELTAQAAAAGLHVMNNVSSRTSLLVTNETSTDTTKATAAARHTIPILTEAAFEALLPNVAPGQPKNQAGSRSRAPLDEVTQNARPATPRPSVADAGPGPLAGRRFLVLGAPHSHAAQIRTEITARGGTAGVNLTARTTDLVALERAERDPRLYRAKDLGIPLADPVTFERMPTTGEPSPEKAITGPVPADSTRQMRLGEVIDLPETVVSGTWNVAVQWHQVRAKADVDVVAFLTDSDNQVFSDADFLFFNAPRSDDGAVDLTLDTPGEALVDVRCGDLAGHIERLTVAAALSEGQFGDLGPVEVTLYDPSGAPHARATLDAATTENTMLLASIYRRAGAWRFRAIGQGYDEGLAQLAALHGVDVEQG